MSEEKKKEIEIRLEELETNLRKEYKVYNDVINKIEEMEPIAKMIYSIIVKKSSFNSSLKTLITNISEIMFNLFIASKKNFESQSKEEIKTSLNRLKDFVHLCNFIPQNFKKSLENMELDKKETSFVEGFLPLLEQFDFSGLYKALKDFHSHNSIKDKEYYFLNRKRASRISKIHTLFFQIYIKTLDYKNIMRETIENADSIFEKLHNNISKASSIELEVLEILPPLLEYIYNSLDLSLYSEDDLIFYKDNDLSGYNLVLSIIIANIQYVLNSDDYILEDSSRGYLVDLLKSLEEIDTNIKLIEKCMEDLDPTISESKKDVVAKTAEIREKTLRYTKKSDMLIDEELDKISVLPIKHSFSKPTMWYTLLSIIRKKKTVIIFEGTLYEEILMFFQYLFQDLFEFTLSILPKKEFQQKKDRLEEFGIIHVHSPLEDERVMDTTKFSELARMIDNFYESSHEKTGEAIVLKNLKKELEYFIQKLSIVSVEKE